MPQTPETALEIDLQALAHNYGVIRSRLKEQTRLLGVVKAFAYGNEAVAISRKLENLGADYLAVAFSREGVQLRKSGIRLPILVLHPQPEGLDEVIEHCLEPSLYSRRIFSLFLEALEKHRQKEYPVHLKFNTGLNRLGFPEADLNWIGSQINASEAVEVRSFFSHLAASDDLGERAYTLGQIRAFENIVQKSESLLGGRPFKHLLNTSGVFNYPEAQFDMVRTGIGLYGYSNDPETDRLETGRVGRDVTQDRDGDRDVPGDFAVDRGLARVEPEPAVGPGHAVERQVKDVRGHRRAEVVVGDE